MTTTARARKKAPPFSHDQKEDAIANNIGGSPGIRKEASVCVANRP